MEGDIAPGIRRIYSLLSVCIPANFIACLNCYWGWLQLWFSCLAASVWYFHFIYAPWHVFVRLSKRHIQMLINLYDHSFGLANSCIYQFFFPELWSNTCLYIDKCVSTHSRNVSIGSLVYECQWGDLWDEIETWVPLILLLFILLNAKNWFGSKLLLPLKFLANFPKSLSPGAFWNI